MIVRYLGHSCFFISSAKGTTIIVDPYGPQTVRYQFPTITADFVLISHEHRDHNASFRVDGAPYVMKRTHDFPVEYEVVCQRTGEKIAFFGIPSFHDRYSGRRKGPNTIWHWYQEGIHYCHLGDLGHLLTDDQLKILDKVDVCFLPVGGGCVLEPTEAALVINQLTPPLVFPMHYKTPLTDTDLANEPLETFLSRMDNVDMAATMAIDVDIARMPSRTRIVVLNYE